MSSPELKTKPPKTLQEMDLDRRLRIIEMTYGICSVCGHEITHDMTEPFASCSNPACVNAGTMEWTGNPPIISQLRSDLWEIDRSRRRWRRAALFELVCCVWIFACCIYLGITLSK
jgi:hypothetical protein